MQLKTGVFIGRKEEDVSTDPTFDVSVIFGKRDEVSTSANYYDKLLLEICPAVY